MSIFSKHHRGIARNGEQIEKEAVLLGKIASVKFGEMQTIDNLAQVEFSVFSQFGEDGIIDWLVQKLKISNKTFIEFGVENYVESNTRFLMMNRNWRGLVIDSNPQNIASIKEKAMYWRHDLTAACAFITRENIKQVIKENGFWGPLGILSIDLDGNDYWIMSELIELRPELLIVECNPIFGDRHPISTPYDPRFERFKNHFSGLCFGASIKALQDFAEQHDYVFLGSCINGINAFFCTKNIFHFVGGSLKNQQAWPAIHRDSRDSQKNLTFVRGKKRFDLIRECEVICLRSNTRIRLKDLDQPYSNEWMQEMALPQEIARSEQ